MTKGRDSRQPKIGLLTVFAHYSQVQKCEAITTLEIHLYFLNKNSTNNKNQF